MNGYLNKTTKPENCLLAITIPLSKEDFYKDLDRKDKDFVKHYKKRFFLQNKSFVKLNGHQENELFWDCDYSNLASKMQGLIKILKKYNVTVIQNFKLSDMPIISNFDVVTFMSHTPSDNERVELYDKLYYHHEFTQYIPSNYTGVIDLINCFSMALLDQINISNYKIIVLGNDSQMTLDIWIIIYKYIIEYLSKKNCDYIQALLAVIDIIRKNLNF